MSVNLGIATRASSENQRGLPHDVLCRIIEFLPPDGLNLRTPPLQGLLFSNLIFQAKAISRPRLISKHPIYRAIFDLRVRQIEDKQHLTAGHVTRITSELFGIRASGACLHTLTGHSQCVKSLAFTPDGSKIASASRDDTIKIWDTSTGSCLLNLNCFSTGIESVKFSADGSKIAALLADGNFKIWDASTGSLLLNLVYSPAKEGRFLHLVFYPAEIESFYFSADGSTIGAYLRDDTFRIWEISTGKCLITGSTSTSYTYDSDFFIPDYSIVSGSNVTSPDGSKIAYVYARAIKIKDASTGSHLQTLTGHTDDTISAVFSPDGSKIVSSSRDCKIKIWDISIPSNVEDMVYTQSCKLLEETGREGWCSENYAETANNDSPHSSTKSVIRTTPKSGIRSRASRIIQAIFSTRYPFDLL